AATPMPGPMPARPAGRSRAHPRRRARRIRRAMQRPPRSARHEPPRPPLAASGHGAGGAAAGAAAAAGAGPGPAPLLAGAGGGLLGDRGARPRRARLRLHLGRGRRPGDRVAAGRACAAAGGDGLHPAALPRPAAVLPARPAGAGDRRPAAQRPGGGRGPPPATGAAAAAVAVLAGAAGGRAAVGTAVPGARRVPVGAGAALMRRRPEKIRNPSAEAAQCRVRALVGLGLVLLARGGLAGWYFRLQVVQHDDFARQSGANRIKPRPVVPARGLIYDRKGRLLADNVPAYRLDVTPEDAGDIPRMLRELSQVVELSPEEIERFEAARRATRSFRAITLKQRLSDEEVARFAVDRWRFPGVEVVAYLNRRYLYGDLLAHVIGYVGRTDEGDVERYGKDHVLFPHTGRTGVERYYDEQLRGKIGYEQVETNVEGRALRSIGMVPARAGTDLRLGIDLDLQRAMVMAFGEQTGSAIAIDPRTGEVLAMVSLPSFDPNLFVNGISNADYRRLMDDPSRPLFSRRGGGGVAPGWTGKPMLALAGLDGGLRKPEDRVLSTGMFYLPGSSRGWGDASRGGHGWTDLRKS